MKILGILLFGICFVFAAPAPKGCSVSEKQKSFNTAVLMSKAEKSAYITVFGMLLDREVDPSFHDNAALLQAVKNNDPEMAMVLLQDSRVDPRARGSMCLEFALRNRNLEMLTLLLKLGADPTARECEVFYKAFEMEDVPAINILLYHAKLVGYHPIRILFAALQSTRWSFEMVETLMKHPKVPFVSWARLLSVALILNNEYAFERLIKNPEVFVSLVNKTDKQFLYEAMEIGSLPARENAAFRLAVQQHDNNMVAYLMKRRIGVPFTNELIYAVTHGNAIMTKMLLDDRRVDPEKALRQALLKLDKAIIWFFLNDRRSDNYIDSFACPSELRDAMLTPSTSDISYKVLPIIAILLRQHERFRTSVLMSWLRPAVKRNKVAVARLFQELRFDPYAKFMEAIKTGDYDILDQMMDLPLVDPTAHHSEALHEAVCRPGSLTMSVLLKSGMVDAGVRDGTFLPVILELGHQEKLKMMLQHLGCKPSVNNNFALRLALRKKDLASAREILSITWPEELMLNIGTLLMEAVRSGFAEIVARLTYFPTFPLTLGDLKMAMDEARKMNNFVIMALLEAATWRASAAPTVHIWNFSVDPAHVLVWLRASLKIIHGYYRAVKPIAEMIQDIVAGRPAHDNPNQPMLGFELLKLAFEDFMMSRMEMSEVERRDLFVKIMTTEYVPKSMMWGQPESRPAVVMPTSRKRTRQEWESKAGSSPASEVGRASSSCASDTQSSQA
jgi:hypothetical protein